MSELSCGTRALRGQFLRYVPLNVLGMLALSCYILADTFFVANGVGADGLTALNLVLPLYSFISGLGLLFGMGGATKYAIFMAAGQREDAQRVFTQAVLLCVGAGVPLSVLGFFFTAPLCVLLGADAVIAPLAAEYLGTILLFSPAFILNNALVCFVRNDSSPKLSMLAMLLGSLCNVGLDYLFIFPLGWGMFGAAIATCLAPLIGIATLSFHLLSPKSNLRLRRCHLTLRHSAQLCAIGFSAFFTEFSSGIVMLIFNFIILSLAGNAGVAAYGIVANLNLFAVAIFAGISEGVQPLISGAYGAGNLTALRQVYRWAVGLAVALGSVLYVLIAVFAAPIAQLFNRDGGAGLTQLASQGICLYFPLLLLAGFNIVTASLFASMTRAAVSFSLSLLRSFLLVLLFAVALSIPFGMTGVWLAMPCTEAVTFGLTAFFYKRLRLPALPPAAAPCTEKVKV